MTKQLINKPMIYFIRDGNGHIKIGITQNIRQRMQALQSAHANKLEFYYGLYVETVSDAREIESILHSVFKDYRLMGEWFLESEPMKWLKQKKIEIGDYYFNGFKGGD